MVKNRKGSSLIFVLMVFTVLMIFASFTVGFMVTENKQSLFHQHKTQAYYIARSGAVAVEAAILKMDEDDIEKLYEELDKGEVVVDEIDIDGNKVNVVLNKDGDKLNIESVASVRDIVEKVTKVMETENISTEAVEIDMAIFSNGSMDFQNQTQKNIIGDIGTNANNGIIEYGNNGFNSSTVVNIPRNSDKNIILKRIQNSGNTPETNVQYIDTRTYPLPIFPDFPPNESIKDFTLGGSDSKTIDSSDNYRNLTINANTKFHIDASASDIILNIKNFNLNNGHIIIIGNNKVTFYINNMVIGSGSTINYHNNQPGDSKKFDLFYNGINELTIAGSQKISGNLLIEKADIKVTSGGGILGNIISRGGNVTISGGSSVHTGIIYAPHAKVKLEQGGSVAGAVISDTFTMSGGAKIEYKPEYIDTSLINVESSTSSSSSYKPGYFK